MAFLEIHLLSKHALQPQTPFGNLALQPFIWAPQFHNHLGQTVIVPTQGLLFPLSNPVKHDHYGGLPLSGCEVGSESFTEFLLGVYAHIGKGLKPSHYRSSNLVQRASTLQPRGNNKSLVGHPCARRVCLNPMSHCSFGASVVLEWFENPTIEGVSRQHVSFLL